MSPRCLLLLSLCKRSFDPGGMSGIRLYMSWTTSALLCAVRLASAWSLSGSEPVQGCRLCYCFQVNDLGSNRGAFNPCDIKMLLGRLHVMERAYWSDSVGAAPASSSRWGRWMGVS